MFFSFLSIGIYFLIIVLILIVAFKVLIKKERPSNYYTPFDNITGQENKAFHEEKQEQIQHEEETDDVRD
ncbi:DUF3951 domain-containing protein [Gracilibacillus saliphilus]|uniref:DUF3951 domain-containing protein n=1 Tax=Gracilibacillus saliphilus TaxID=543890 RepID=UPI0013D6797C|nr:DUF3951 domain-containing protein [Gracilibacillus saliphilus]